MPDKAVIQRQRRIFDDFFQIEEFVVSHEQVDGTMSADQRRLVFERGDAVAVLLLNLDSRSVVLVEQFKIAALVGRRRDDPSTLDGWIVETVAGIIEPNETPETAVIREAREETGYRIRNPKLISQFFSSPGGTSERLFLYFAEVRESDKFGAGGGIGDEDVRIVQLTLADLFDRLAKGVFEDPKLLIAAYWLLDQLKSSDDRKRVVEAYWDRSAPSTHAPVSPPASGQQPLSLSTVRYAIKNRNGFLVGYKTGAIDRITDVSVWVNSENTDMMMDRFLGKSISATIRYLGANKDEHDNVIEDTIEEALRSAVGRRAHVKVGTVLVTESGALRVTNNVMQIFHLATVEGVGAGRGIKADLTKLAHCLDNLLKRADNENNRLSIKWFRRKRFESILIPMIGSGDGGLPIEDVAQTIIPAAIEYFQRVDMPTLKEIYFLAYTARAQTACDQVLQRYCTDDVLVQIGDK
jgi:ADP-ribose pyrophosphatase